MLEKNTETIRIVLFSETLAERDVLRRYLNIGQATVLFFEKDTLCFDNLSAIRPHLILIRTESRSIVWRFVLVLAEIRIHSTILVVSDSLRSDFFSSIGNIALIKCVPNTEIAIGLDQVIRNLSGVDGQVQNMESLLVGESDSIKSIKSALPSLRISRDPVLITGESGTGKELLARCIMHNSTLEESLSIKLNGSELEGGFIGANSNLASHLTQTLKKLRVENPKKSITMLLDNIDRLTPSVQSEILMLMDGIETDLGSDRVGRFQKIRFIATTQTNLEEMVEFGNFRKDLFFRLNVFPIFLPPLRQRVADIAMLADFFMVRYSIQMKKSMIFFSDHLKQLLVSYVWPGNIDELQRWSRRVVEAGNESMLISVLCSQKNDGCSAELVFQDFDFVSLEEFVSPSSIAFHHHQSLKTICEDYIAKTEKKLLKKALEATQWNRKKAAALLNISYKSILNKIKIYEII